MKLGDVRVACDRCGDEKVVPAKMLQLPMGWQVMEFPPSYKRDMCPKCVSDHRRWWYQGLADEALAAAPGPRGVFDFEASR